jgi:ADP-ribose pyrophosphatase
LGNIEKFQTLSTVLISENPYWKYKIDEYILPDESVGKYYYCDARGSVLVIPQHKDGKISICDQYRYLLGSRVKELCGGAIEVGQTPEEAAYTELRQELGLIGKDFKVIGKFNPYKGVTNEVCYVLFCLVEAETYTDPEQSEEIDRIDVEQSELYSAICESEVHDGMSLAAVQLFSRFINKQI